MRDFSRWTFQTFVTRGAEAWLSRTRWSAGPVDLVYVPHPTNLWSLWGSPRTKSFLRRLSEVVRLTVFNPRGTGLSDRPRNVTLEARMDDINAVLDALKVERATLFGVAESATSVRCMAPRCIQTKCSNSSSSSRMAGSIARAHRGSPSRTAANAS